MTPPTAAQIRALRLATGLTQTEAAALVHSTLRSWQNWESATQNKRRMHPGIWDLFRIRIAQMEKYRPAQK